MQQLYSHTAYHIRGCLQHVCKHVIVTIQGLVSTLHMLHHSPSKPEFVLKLFINNLHNTLFFSRQQLHLLSTYEDRWSMAFNVLSEKLQLQLYQRSPIKQSPSTSANVSCYLLTNIRVPSQFGIESRSLWPDCLVTSSLQCHRKLSVNSINSC